MRAYLHGSWQPFIAEQVISIQQPCFAWLARMAVAPLASARVLDCYVDGRGLLEARLFGSLRLVRAAGPQASKGELMRYLAELPWAAHAMLHNPQLSWREIDLATVEVSAESAAGPARVRLIFENGDITRVEADDRPRAVGRRTVPTPWQGCCCDYREELVLAGWPVRVLARRGNGIPDEVIATLTALRWWFRAATNLWYLTA